MTFPRIALSLVLAASLPACGSQPAPVVAPAPPTASTSSSGSGSNESPKAAGTLKAPGEAKVGDLTKCLGSGDEFVVTETSPKVEHAGKTYYFCCPGCAEKFKKDPSKYLDPK